MSDGSGKYLFAMVLVILLGFALGANGLNSDIVWMDEMFSLGNMGAFNSPFNPSQVVASLANNSPDHVPLYFVLGALWAQLVGWSQVAIRYFSLLAGVLMIASVYRFAADVIDRRTALLSVLLLSTSGLVILYFHEVRMYTLLLLLIAVHVRIYWRLVASHHANWQTWLAFFAATSALLYTHIFSSFYFAGLCAQHFLFASRSRRWIKIWLALGISSMTFLPYLPVFAIGFADVTNSPNTQSSALPLLELVISAASVVTNDIVLLWIPTIALALIALVRNRHIAILRLLTVLATMLITMLILNGVFQVFSDVRIRYFLIAMPFFAIMYAYVLLANRPTRAIAIPFVLVWMVGGFHIYLQAEHWAFAGHQTLLMDHPPLHRYADALHEKTREHDFILGFAGSPAINWRLKHGWTTADYYTQVILDIDGAFVNARLRGEELLADYEQGLDNNPYLLFVYDPLNKQMVFNDVFEAIHADYTACGIVVDVGEVFVERYVHRMLDCNRKYEPIHYDNGVTIVDKFADYDAEQNTVRVVTGWEVADESQLEEYNVSIQIITPEWANVRQAGDRHLYHDVLKWYVVEMPTAGLPPGDYRAVVILYDRYQSSAKVNGTDATTGEVGTILPVLHFTIDK